MKRQGRRTSRATHKNNTSLVQNEPIRKSYNLRKRKHETEQNDQDKSLVNENTKRRCLKNDDQRTSTQHAMSTREHKMQHTKMDKSKGKQPRFHSQNKKTLLKQPFGKDIAPKIQPMGTKRLTQLSMKKGENSKRKTSDSNTPLLRKKTQVKGEQSLRIKLPKRDKDRKQRSLCGTPKSGKKRILQGTPKPTLTSKAPEKEMVSSMFIQKQKPRKLSRVRVVRNTNQTNEKQLHINIEQSTEPKHCRISKPNTIKRKSTKAARKLVTKINDPLLLGRERSPPKYFSTLFVKKIDTRYYPEASGMSKIHGISVSNDNLIWVNHLRECLQLLNTSGKILQSIHLDHSSVFNCCTPSGDLLETQGYAGGSKPVITMISRDGNSRVLADLSSYATNLCGILCGNEAIFVVAYSSKAEYGGSPRSYFIIKLSMSGEVEEIYNTEKGCDDINNIISLNGQIIALRTDDSTMIPLKGKIISSEKINGVCIESVYSPSASVDNHGNVILASNTEVLIIDPSLEFMHKIDAGIGSITSTAVDKNSQLWLGTESGGLYSAQYLT
ncbi:uncharacterized protein LOC125683532 isoform X2 [Ostrea edulis]|nr:uncharacterized protein LOC125683532 isoform X2 [Ostrea edulis]XP_048780749.2 uncharacterized protein LOC125683532 isoform X2 [Ostrea edulis]XP_048780750.2 uncharacterized protein LOC125683532 isoform X2 [Ostrea edulis]